MKKQSPSDLKFTGLALWLCAISVLGGCAATGGGDVKPEEPVIVRPVVVVETAEDEMVKALALIREGNYRQAEANLEEILKVRPDLPEAHLNLGWTKQQLKRHADAVTHLHQGLKLKPDEHRAYALIALSQRELGEFAAAEATYKQGLALAPAYDKLHLNLGILYELYLFRPAEALTHYRQYQSLQPSPDAKVAGWIAVLERQEARK